MSNSHYRPLDTEGTSSKNIGNGYALRSTSSAIRYHWSKSTLTRKILAFGMLVFMLVVYLVWCALAASSREEISYAAAPYLKLQRSRQTSATSGFSRTQFSTYSNTQKPTTRMAMHHKSLPKSSAVSRAVNESLVVCSEVFVDSRAYIQNRPRKDYEQLPIIYFVTPTYPRREQVPELTRLAHTLLHVPRIHWILANDYGTCNVFLDFLLNKFGIPFTHLSSPMPFSYRKKKPMPRGVANRRAAIYWLRQHNITNGILYFGDDDNTYDLKLFSEIRDTHRVSMFPVGLIEDYSVSGPVVRKGKVVGFLDSWVADRHWPVDMAGFAVNLAFMSEHPNASMPYKPGYEEDYFLRSISLKLDYIEPKGNDCTEILVWHTQTKSRNRSIVRINREYLDDRSNLGALFKSLEIMGVSVASETEGTCFSTVLFLLPKTEIEN
ncbi:galactosylgalactosylxylosylprotein 3-beta-glucuronosyltransferase S isoform X2 [Teleopsis dalmanni]|uniref:galactosylgalactosylxylosylprotein 3-beta-glucuronosyltransferase S isoform X2 n=1 Tax=Teleopsis dalmanni TaxID=139649 RepID=UPI0018CEF04F|nr:galactosylgalactosylxylosylprotein 3-beta-glucuronosyltransferase S isoform X2 [Teleopsis dalmanni]